MKTKLNKGTFTTFPCFFCNVDSTELKVFVFGTIGLLALATVCFGVGLWVRGSFKNTEQLSDLSLKAEQKD